MSHILVIHFILHKTYRCTQLFLFLSLYNSTDIHISLIRRLVFLFLCAPLHWLFYPSMPLLPTSQLPYSESWTHHNHRVPHESHHRNNRIPISITIPTSPTNRVTHVSSTKSTTNQTWQQVLFRVLGHLREMGILLLKPRNTPRR